MKRVYTTHFAFAVSYFIFISLVRGWLDLSYFQLWAGGLIGAVLPDIDHIIYVYFLRPHEVTSQRVASLVNARSIKRTLELLVTTRQERRQLIFHSAFFQIIFFVFAFLILTSSGSLLGRGLVLGFTLHLLVDQLVDLMEIENLDAWFHNLPVKLDKEKATFYWLAGVFVILAFGFLF